MLTYKQKLAQANREAVATVVGLVITVAVWIACGFGLAGLDVQVFHTPLWVVGGTLGTWACAIAVSVVLTHRVFVDFDLTTEAEDAAAPAPDGLGRKAASSERATLGVAVASRRMGEASHE